MTLTTRTLGKSVLLSGQAKAAAAAVLLGGDQHRQSGTDSTVRMRVKASKALLRSSDAGFGYERFVDSVGADSQLRWHRAVSGLVEVLLRSRGQVVGREQAELGQVGVEGVEGVEGVKGVAGVDAVAGVVGVAGVAGLVGVVGVCGLVGVVGDRVKGVERVDGAVHSQASLSSPRNTPARLLLLTRSSAYSFLPARA